MNFNTELEGIKEKDIGYFKGSEIGDESVKHTCQFKVILLISFEITTNKTTFFYR